MSPSKRLSLYHWRSLGAGTILLPYFEQHSQTGEIVVKPALVVNLYNFVPDDLPMHVLYTLGANNEKWPQHELDDTTVFAELCNMEQCLCNNALEVVYRLSLIHI